MNESKTIGYLIEVWNNEAITFDLETVGLRERIFSHVLTMATRREYFDTDFPAVLSIARTVTLTVTNPGASSSAHLGHAREAVIEVDSFPTEQRFDVYGRTANGRYLLVVFTLRGDRKRCVTAYPMNRSTRRKYAPYL